MNDDTAADDQFIDFKCPCCGEETSFPATSANSVQECLNCTEAILVPAPGGEGRKIPLPFATSKLTLRKFRGEDWKDMLHLFSDDEFFAAAPFKWENEEQISGWLEEDAVVKLTSPGVPFILAVESKENAKVIGRVSLVFSDAARQQAILSVVIHRDFQPAVMNVAAAVGALEFCFTGIHLHRVQGFCSSTEIAVCELFEKAGMRREGEFVADHKKDDKWANTVAYAILREEFKTAAGQ
jgi:RimJ/RimL family protein N-acetyltransferase